LLDVGCGPGMILGQLVRDFTPRIAFGVEPNAEHATRARAVASVLRADGARMPFADASVDAVLLRFVLRHLPGRQQVLDEAVRGLRPGGHVFITEVDDDTFLLEPEPPGWRELRSALDESARRRGGDSTLGRRVRSLLTHPGLAEPRLQILPVTTED